MLTRRGADDGLWLLQARPMTALPDPVDWIPPAPGYWMRNLRLGEWLPEPMTPLFADWLLERLDHGEQQATRSHVGAALAFPHAAINGWYYLATPPLSPRTIATALLQGRGRLLRFMRSAVLGPGRDPVAADRRLLAHCILPPKSPRPTGWGRGCAGSGPPWPPSSRTGSLPMYGSCIPPEGPTAGGRCDGPRWRPGQAAPCTGWSSSMPSADQRLQRQPARRPGRRGSSGREPAGRAAGQPLRDPRRAHQHPNSCWFCLWDGYGWLHGSPSVAILGPRGSIPVPPAFPAQVLDGPRVRLPGRDYLLFAGPLAAAPQLGWTDPNGLFWPQSPNLFWPHDHAWCVASEIDLFCTLVAGSDELAEALVGDPRLEAWPVQPTDPIAFDSDQINT